jgi:hypothetical protein
VLLFLEFFIWISSTEERTEDYYLPVMPVHKTEFVKFRETNSSSNLSYKKHIPRRIWIAVKDEKDALPVYQYSFLNIQLKISYIV